jgi:hypothetical protein
MKTAPNSKYPMSKQEYRQAISALEAGQTCGASDALCQIKKMLWSKDNGAKQRLLAGRV